MRKQKKNDTSYKVDSDEGREEVGKRRRRVLVSIQMSHLFESLRPLYTCFINISTFAYNQTER